MPLADQYPLGSSRSHSSPEVLSSQAAIEVGVVREGFCEKATPKVYLGALYNVSKLTFLWPEIHLLENSLPWCSPAFFAVLELAMGKSAILSIHGRPLGTN